VVKAKVAGGERVLILAGADGVGHVAVQLCKARGTVVYASCRKANLEFVRGLGAAHAIERNGEDVAAAIGELTDSEGVDVILESMGGDHIERALNLLAEGGRLASINVEERPQSLLQAFLKFVTLHLVLVRPHREKLAGLTELVEAGELRPHVEQVFALSEVGAAHARLEAGGVRGKLVLDHGL
jgi:NADPH2:quinone reductase